MLPEARKSARLLAISWAVSWIAVPISGAFGSVIVHRLTNDLALTGVPFFLLYLGSLLSAYPAGRLMDRHGRRPVIIAGHLVSALGFTVGTIAILLENLWLFFAAQFVAAMGASAAYLTRLAAADLYPMTERARGMGRLASWLVIGAVAAVPLIWLAGRAEPLLGQSYLALAWGVVPLVSLLSAFFVYRIHPDPMQTALAYRDLEPAHPVHLGPRLDEPTRKRSLLAAGATLLFAQAAMASVMSVSGASLQQHGHSPDFIILTLTLHVVGMFGFSPLIGVLGDHWGRKPLLVASGVYLLGSTLLVRQLASGNALMVGLVLVGIGWSFAFIGANAVVADLAAVAHRGRITGLVDVGTALIGGSASLLAGWALDRGGLSQVGVVGFGFALALMVAALLMPSRAAPRLAAPLHDVPQ